jgi:hypothetical protein
MFLIIAPPTVSVLNFHDINIRQSVSNRPSAPTKKILLRRYFYSAIEYGSPLFRPWILPFSVPAVIRNPKNLGLVIVGEMKINIDG